MSSDKRKSGYTTIKITQDFAQYIDEIMNKSKLRYESRTDFIRQAVNEYYRYLNDKDLIKEKK